MNQDQVRFVEFAVRTGALKFGSFTLKSGRQSPYYFNSGAFSSGSSLETLGVHYARVIKAMDVSPTLIFGPAYKGIPLAVATSIALWNEYKLETSWCFDRKEAKTHGDAGILVGKCPTENDRILMVDDVITDGATKIEAIRQLRELSPAPIVGLVIALNRQEKSANGEDPIRFLEQSSGVPVRSIVTLRDVTNILRDRVIDGHEVIPDEVHSSILSYLKEYGVK